MSSRSPEVIRNLIESAITEGEAHLRHIERAVGILEDHFPLTESGLHSLCDEIVPILDQFIYRFTKLQDSMASRLLPSLDSYLRSDDSPRPFLDRLSSLEQLGVIPSENDWQFLRGLRNNLAHDYPESAAQTVSTLNTLYERWTDLRRMFVTARDYYRSRPDPPAGEDSPGDERSSV